MSDTTTTEPTAPEPTTDAAESAAETAERDAYDRGWEAGFLAAMHHFAAALARSPSGRIQVDNLNRNVAAHKRGEG